LIERAQLVLRNAILTNLNRKMIETQAAEKEILRSLDYTLLIALLRAALIIDGGEERREPFVSNRSTKTSTTYNNQ
jgi:hypothetical protein